MTSIFRVGSISYTSNWVYPLNFRSSSWTTLVRSRTDMRQCWIATLLTLPANSLSSKRRSTVVPARSWKTSHSTWSLVTPPWLTWSPRSPCASRPSPTTLLWDVSPFVTWGRPSPVGVIKSVNKKDASGGKVTKAAQKAQGKKKWRSWNASERDTTAPLLADDYDHHDQELYIINDSLFSPQQTYASHSTTGLFEDNQHSNNFALYQCPHHYCNTLKLDHCQEQRTKNSYKPHYYSFKRTLPKQQQIVQRVTTLLILFYLSVWLLRSKIHRKEFRRKKPYVYPSNIKLYSLWLVPFKLSTK